MQCCPHQITWNLARRCFYICDYCRKLSRQVTVVDQHPRDIFLKGFLEIYEEIDIHSINCSMAIIEAAVCLLFLNPNFSFRHMSCHLMISPICPT